jgi:hypothetical protein
MPSSNWFKVVNLNKKTFKLINCNKCAPKNNNELLKLKKHGSILSIFLNKWVIHYHLFSKLLIRTYYMVYYKNNYIDFF